MRFLYLKESLYAEMKNAKSAKITLVVTQFKEKNGMWIISGKGQLFVDEMAFYVNKVCIDFDRHFR
jgi:hypothetical protein